MTNPTPFSSVEDFRRFGEPVMRVFQVALNRRPDPIGMRVFARRLEAGAPLAEMVGAVCDSEEFRGIHGVGDEVDDEFLVRLFRFAYRRPPIARELKRFRAQVPLVQGRTEAVVAVMALRDVWKRLTLLERFYPDGASPDDDLAYGLWLLQHGRLGARALTAIDRHMAHFAARPLMSLIMVAGSGRPDLLLDSTQSLDRQLYPEWEVCIAVPEGMPPRVVSQLETLRARLPGVRLIPVPAEDGDAPQVGALWRAAAEAARGDYVGFLEAGDQLAPAALYEIAAALDRDPALSLIYTDEDSIDGAGNRSAALLKPGWSPDGLLVGDVLGQLCMVRRSEIAHAGGVRAEAGELARYDLMLRVTDRLAPTAIAHVPVVAYHRGRKPGRPLPFPRDKAILVHRRLHEIMSAHLARTGSPLAVQDADIGGGVWPRCLYPDPQTPPLVSILIATRDQPKLLERCIEGLLHRTDYPNIEILIGDNGSVRPQTLQLLRRLARDERIRVERIETGFNWSEINNRLAALATGSVLLMLNDDTEVLAPGWLSEMVRQLARPGVGVVGARLFYRDGSVQHAGIVLTTRRATHVLRSARAGEPGYLGQLCTARDMQAVTGACLAVHADLFARLGGFDPAFRVTCNDVDFCLRVREAGHRVVWTPHAWLTHVDGASRGRPKTLHARQREWLEIDRLFRRWPEAMAEDPFLNANLVVTDHDLVLATAPRRLPSWAAWLAPLQPGEKDETDPRARDPDASDDEDDEDEEEDEEVEAAAEPDDEADAPRAGHGPSVPGLQPAGQPG